MRPYPHFHFYSVSVFNPYTVINTILQSHKSHRHKLCSFPTYNFSAVCLSLRVSAIATTTSWGREITLYERQTRAWVKKWREKPELTGRLQWFSHLCYLLSDKEDVTTLSMIMKKKPYIPALPHSESQTGGREGRNWFPWQRHSCTTPINPQWRQEITTAKIQITEQAQKWQ